MPSAGGTLIATAIADHKHPFAILSYARSERTIQADWEVGDKAAVRGRLLLQLVGFGAVSPFR